MNNNQNSSKGQIDLLENFSQKPDLKQKQFSSNSLKICKNEQNNKENTKQYDPFQQENEFICNNINDSQQKKLFAKQNKKITGANPSLVEFFRNNQKNINPILDQWKQTDENLNNQQDEMKAKFIELSTYPKAFVALKNFHLKLAQSDQMFAQTYYEKEVQENDKHSQVIHKACQDGAGEQQIALLVNSHLQKQEQMESEFKNRFDDQGLVFLSEYEQLINQLYEQRQEFLSLKLQDLSDNAQQSNMYEEFLTEIQNLDTSTNVGGSINNGSNQSAYSQITSGIQNLISGSNKKNEGNKHKIQLCLGMQKKRIFQIQISSKSIQSVLSNLNYLKKINFDNNTYNNFIYGQNQKNAILNIMTSVSKFNHHLKRYFKFRTDIHFPSLYQQYQDANLKKNIQVEGDVVVTRHSCSGNVHYMFTITRKEDNKKLDFGFLKYIIKISNEFQIKKIIIPIQLIVMQQKDLKTNTEFIKEFCTTLKRELQILSYDYTYTQQFLQKIEIILPLENNRMKEMYEKIKDVLLQVLE
ncbi:hypothetical protein ABPG72_017417 [Tetrahymena utriculariae]